MANKNVIGRAYDNATSQGGALSIISFKGIAEALLLATLLAPTFTDAKGSGSHSGSHSSGNYSGGHSSAPHSGGHPKAAVGVPRDSHGRIARSEKSKDDFKKTHPCPSTGKGSGACPGYVIDHVKPLERGGADSPGNMQWQTKEAAKIKDKTE
jgi:hypothetical protein